MEALVLHDEGEAFDPHVAVLHAIVDDEPRVLRDSCAELFGLWAQAASVSPGNGRVRRRSAAG